MHMQKDVFYTPLGLERKKFRSSCSCMRRMFALHCMHACMNRNESVENEQYKGMHYMYGFSSLSIQNSNQNEQLKC